VATSQIAHVPFRERQPLDLDLEHAADAMLVRLVRPL
jgi:hypothetical protein